MKANFFSSPTPLYLSLKSRLKKITLTLSRHTFTLPEGNIIDFSLNSSEGGYLVAIIRLCSSTGELQQTDVCIFCKAKDYNLCAATQRIIEHYM